MDSKVSFKSFINEDGIEESFEIEKAENYAGGDAWIVSTESDVAKIIFDSFHDDGNPNGIFNKVQTVGNERLMDDKVKEDHDYIAFVYYSDELNAEESMANAKKIVRYFKDHGKDES